MNEGLAPPRFEGGVTKELNGSTGGENRGAGSFVGVSKRLRDVARGMDDGETDLSDDGLVGEGLAGS